MQVIFHFISDVDKHYIGLSAGQQIGGHPMTPCRPALKIVTESLNLVIMLPQWAITHRTCTVKRSTLESEHINVRLCGPAL